MSTCRHPKEVRSLLYGYDVMCDACGELIGRVALFPCAVLTAQEARALIEGLETTKTARDARGKLELVVDRARA